MTAHVLALTVDVRMPHSSSLKDKRAVVKTITEGARRRFQVAAAETGSHHLRQRAELSFAAVSSSAGHAGEIVDELERFVWSFPEIEIVSADRAWLETS